MREPRGAEQELVVLEDIERGEDRLTGIGRIRDGSLVRFPIDEAMLVGIVRLLALSNGAPVWVRRSRMTRAEDIPADRMTTSRRGTADGHAAGPGRLPGTTASDPFVDPPRTHRPLAGPNRVLLVLPDRFVGSLVAGELDRAGYDVELVPARAALEAVRDSTVPPPAAVVLDLVQPDGPAGVALARSIAAERPATGIVFLTRLPDARFIGGEIAPNRRTAYLRLGGDHHADRLLEAVDAVIGRRSGRHLRDDLDPARPLGSLSNRQLSLLGELARGTLLADIASARGVSERGAQRLLSRTYARLGIAARRSGHARSLAVRSFCDAAGMAPLALDPREA